MTTTGGELSRHELPLIAILRGVRPDEAIAIGMALIDAGIDCIKIEGRAKSAYYAAIVTGAYRHVLDDVAAGREADPVWRDEVLPLCPGSGSDEGTLHTADEVEDIARATEDWYEGRSERWTGPDPRG